MTLYELGLSSYSEYLDSSYWRNLTGKYIFNNHSAECFVCRKSYSLLLHHVDYEALGEEILNRDVFILCWDCHKKAHWIFLIIKIPLSYKNLINRLYILKITFCIRSFDFIKALWYFLKIVI